MRRIKKAAGQLEKAGHGDNIVWLKRGLLVLGGLGIAGASDTYLQELSTVFDTAWPSPAAAT